MTCVPIKSGDVRGFLCGGKALQQVSLCECGRVATYLCDHPVGRGRTCDRPLCDGCAVHHPPDTDYCQPHGRQLPLLEVT